MRLATPSTVASALEGPSPPFIFSLLQHTKVNGRLVVADDETFVGTDGFIYKNETGSSVTMSADEATDLAPANITRLTVPKPCVAHDLTRVNHK